MFGATRRFLRRNRTNLAVGFGVLGIGYLATQYVFSKLLEARERMSIDRIGRENLRRRFEQNQEDCTFTVLALLPTATENILEALPVENITHELQQKKAERLAHSTGNSEVAPSEFSSTPPSVTDDDGRSMASFRSESYVHASQMAESGEGGGGPGQHSPQRPKKTKAQLWNELKISSIARSFTLLYTLSLLTLLTRIQLNLLGRRNYLSSVVSLASPPQQESMISLENHDDDKMEEVYGSDFETNRRYLTFSWWLLHRGWWEMKNKVETAVKDVFGNLNPREDITLEKLSELILEVRKKTEGATEEERRSSKWLSYLLPPQEQEDFVLRESGMSPFPESPAPAAPSTTSPERTTPLRRLLDETSDLIDSPPFTHVLTKLLDAGFSVLVDQKLASQAFKFSSNAAAGSRIQEIVGNEVKTKVANILAVMTRQAHSIGNGVPNEYLQAMEGVRDLEGFAAIVYSSNFDFEAPSGGEELTAEDEPSAPSSMEAEQGGELEKSEMVGERGSMVDAESGFESAWGKALGTKRDISDQAP
ncbi:MAG: peroxin [Pycnora praestabilis]|nr:MAG: peroxin [Pycnora praestabilis]